MHITDTLRDCKSNIGNARLQFKQPIKHLQYFYLVFFKLNHYCSKGPYNTKIKINNINYTGLAFTTRSLPCLTMLYNIFYKDGIKIVPNELFELMT